MSCERYEPLLDGFHDGELGVLARWRVARHVGRCADCRDAVAGLAEVGHWVRQVAGDAVTDVDIWSGLSAQLPATPVPARPARAWRLRLAAPLVGAGALAAASLGLVALSPELFAPSGDGVVRSLNTHGRPVMVLDEPGQATVIWLMDERPKPTPPRPEEVRVVWI